MAVLVAPKMMMPGPWFNVPFATVLICGVPAVLPPFWITPVNNVAPVPLKLKVRALAPS